MNKLNKTVLLSILVLGFATFVAQPTLAATGYTVFGDATITSPGYNSAAAARIRSSSSIAPNYGGVDFDVPAGLTVADLDTLSLDYNFTAGSCGGGAPRFAVDATNGTNSGSIFIYIGPYPSYTNCPQNIWTNTGNLATGTNFVDSSQLGGTFYDTYSNVQTAFGTYEITSIQLVTDGYWAVGGVQTMLADNVKINAATYTFESANSCKNGGWQLFVSSPGPFTNQGQCVSYYAKGGQ